MIEYDPNLSSCTSPPPNKEPEDCGATTHATEEPKKERPAETPVLHKLSNSKEVVMFFENMWRVELELEGDIGPRRRTLEILRDQGIAGDILFSFDTKQELIDNLKEGGISHFLAIAVADQVSLQKANIFQKLKSEVDRHKIVELLPLDRPGTPRIVKPPHGIDQSLNSPVLDRSNEVDFVLSRVISKKYLERPVLFQCLNMSGVGKTFFGLRLADQLFQRCQPLSQPAEDWKSKLAVIDKEILSEFDENTLRLIHAHTKEAVLAPHPRTNSGSGAQPTESLQAVCNEATPPEDQQPGRESDPLSKWRSKLAAVYQQIISELGQDTLNIILAPVEEEPTDSTQWEYLQAIRNGGTTVMMDWNGSGSHDTLHPVERKSESLAISPEEMAYAFVCLRLLARLDNKWGQEFITQYNITPQQYMSLSTVTNSQIAEMLVKLADHSNRNRPSLLVFHFDEPQLLLNNILNATSWNNATPARRDWTTKFAKAVHLRICNSRKELWNKYKILLVVIQTGTMSQYFAPTELISLPVPLSCLSVSSVLRYVPNLVAFFSNEAPAAEPATEHKPGKRKSKKKSHLMELEVLLQRFGFLAFLLEMLDNTESSKQLWFRSKQHVLKEIEGFLKSGLEIKMHNLRKPHEAEQYALLVHCFCALAKLPLPEKHYNALAAYRYSGHLLGVTRGTNFYPANVPWLLETYRKAYETLNLSQETYSLMYALKRCLKPFLGGDTAEEWEEQLHGVIAARVLGHQLVPPDVENPLSWGTIFSQLQPFKGPHQLNTDFRSAPVHTKLNSMLQFNIRNGSKTLAGDHNSTDFLYLACAKQKGFDVGINDDRFICLLQAKDYAEGASLPKQKLIPFLEHCVDVARQHPQKTVVGIVVAKRTMKPLSTMGKEGEDYLGDNHPKNLELYHLSNAREHLLWSYSPNLKWS